MKQKHLTLIAIGNSVFTSLLLAGWAPEPHLTVLWCFIACTWVLNGVFAWLRKDAE